MFNLKGKDQAARQQERMFRQEMSFNREQDALQSSNYGDELYMNRKDITSDLTRWQQDLNDEIETVVHNLRREYINNKGQWERQTEFTGEYETLSNGKEVAVYRELPPLMNEQGIMMMRSVLQPLISRNLMMSNYESDQIYTKLRNIVFAFINHLALHYSDYEIRKEDLPIIVRMFKDTIEPAHWRSLKQGERHFLNTIQKRVEAIAHSPDQQQKPKGFLDGLMR